MRIRFIKGSKIQAAHRTLHRQRRTGVLVVIFSFMTYQRTLVPKSAGTKRASKLRFFRVQRRIRSSWQIYGAFLRCRFLFCKAWRQRLVLVNCQEVATDVGLLLRQPSTFRALVHDHCFGAKTTARVLSLDDPRSQMLYECVLPACSTICRTKQEAQRHHLRHVARQECPAGLPESLRSKSQKPRGNGEFYCVVPGCKHSEEGRGLATTATLRDHYRVHLKHTPDLEITDEKVRFSSMNPPPRKRRRRLTKA